jgi:hypothetical protein
VTRALLAFAACALALSASASARQTTRPAVHVKATEPFTVVGSHFVAGERVSVVVRMNGRYTHTVIANRNGAFAVVFRSIAYDVCSGYLVVATGDRGSRARSRLTPECTPFLPAL